MREPAMINYSQGSSGLSNIRDLGGIAVSDGRHVKEGLLVRSEALCNASNDDLSRINRTFNLKVVIDFRTQDEYAIQPDPVDKLPTVRFIHVPIVNPASLGAPDDGKLDPQIIIRKLCEDPTAFMGRMYRDMVLQKRGREGYRTFFKTLLETDSGTVLWHCTEGKDRTGVASALLLHLLGATDLVIESDYALLMAFDPYTNHEIMELLKEQFHVDMLSQEQVKEYYKFPVMCLLRIKESIDTWEKHSGSDGYFDFIEGYMGKEIKGNDMNSSIMSSGVLDM